MRIPSGVTDQYIYFVGVDSTDLKTRETGLSSFTVYRSRDGGAAAAMTTPTINETDSTNMPGVYELLLDEDMTITAGNDSEEMVFHITHAGMAPVTRTIELYRSKITAGYTLGVESDGDLTKVNTLDGHTAQTGDNYARIGAPAGASVSADIAAIESQTDDIGVAGAGLTAVPWNAAWDAEVQSEVQDAIEVNKLDHLVAVAESDDPVDDSIIAKLAASDGDWSGFSEAADSLEAIRDRGDAAWATGGGGSNSLELASGTIGATGNSTTALHLTGLGYGDDELNGCLLVIYDDSASLYYSTWITDWATSGDLATVETLPFTPQDSTDTYVVFGIKRDVTLANGSHGGTSAVISLSKLEIEATGSEPALRIINTGTGHAASLWAQGSTGSALALSSEGDNALYVYSTSGDAIVTNAIAGDGLVVEGVVIETAITNIVNRLGAFTGTGINTVLGFLRAMMRGDSAITPSDVAGTYDNETDSLEVIANSAGGLDASEIRDAVGLASANLDTQLDALPTAVENADALLGRNIAGGSSAGRLVKDAFRALRNRVAVNSGTMTVYEEDDSTSAWTAAVTEDASADPITEIDPS